mgnify:CR=1 FL=1
MNFRVPAQTASGDLTEIDYVTVYGTNDVEGVTTAKPLINVFVYGPVIGFEDFSQSGFPGHGKRDAFAAVSLDDGETWKQTNLSESADLTSFNIETDHVAKDQEPLLAESDRIGPYILRDRIGVGGMGEVWKAEQTEPVRRTVALKIDNISRVVFGPSAEEVVESDLEQGS